MGRCRGPCTCTGPEEATPPVLRSLVEGCLEDLVGDGGLVGHVDVPAADRLSGRRRRSAGRGRPSRYSSCCRCAQRPRTARRTERRDRLRRNRGPPSWNPCDHRIGAPTVRATSPSLVGATAAATDSGRRMPDPPCIKASYSPARSRAVVEIPAAGTTASGYCAGFHRLHERAGRARHPDRHARSHWSVGVRGRCPRVRVVRDGAPYQLLDRLPTTSMSDLAEDEPVRDRAVGDRVDRPAGPGLFDPAQRQYHRPSPGRRRCRT